MKKIPLRFKSGLTLLALAPFFCVNQPVFAQSAPAQDTRPAQDRDTTRGELVSFDNFLDQHREIAEQLRRNPSLVNDEEFVKTHPALQDYLKNHPGVREEIRENPNSFMRAENRFDRQEDNRRKPDITRGELLSFDNFLDQHREIAADVRKNPSLVNNEQYLKDHPALQDYLNNRPGVREEIRENPDAFMHAENRFDRREDNLDRREDTGNRDRDFDRRTNREDITRGELQSFDNFLDQHREISEQLRKNPSLVNDEQFLKDHPALQDYLNNRPGVREEIRENPNAFMHAENRFDRREDNLDRRENDHDRDISRGNNRGDITRGELQSFDNFLDKHREISEQLRKNPSLVQDKEFVKNHPALQDYLQNHPGVREEIRENPNAFMHQEARFDRHEDASNRHEEGFDRDRRGGGMDHDAMDHGSMHRRFGEFLGGHSDIAQQLSKDPSQVKNEQFLKSHPELNEYLKAHPQDRQALMANPQSFIKNAQQFTNNTQTAKPPAAKPKPNQ